MYVAVCPHAKADVRLLGTLTSHHYVRTVDRTGRDGRRVAVQVSGQGEPRSYEFQDLGLVQRACGADHNVGQAVMRIGVLADVVAREAAYRLFRPRRIAAQRI